MSRKGPGVAPRKPAHRLQQRREWNRSGSRRESPAKGRPKIAQDRFAAGVANGLEGTQAQEAVAGADENYISSLYTLNVAEASLARAMGTAETTIKSIFGGK